MKKVFSKAHGGFTLVEVMLAVGVIAISISAMIGLLASITASLNVTKHRNKAIALVPNVETTLEAESFSKVYRWIQNPAVPYIIYYWDEYQNPDNPDNMSLITMSSELTGNPREVPSQARMSRIYGDVYRVVLSLYKSGLNGTHPYIGSNMEYSGGALPGTYDEYALSYIPIKIDIYAEPRSDITSGVGTKEKNEQRLVYTDIIMKLR